MCFSAGASFGAGIVLSAIGVASIKKVKNPSQLFFAGIPLLFSVQQIAEGFLWLALTNSYYSPVQSLATYTFLFFAQVVWPIWVPLSMLLFEKDKQRKKILGPIVAIGILVSIYLAYCLVSFKVEAKATGFHISYLLDYPISFRHYGGILYIASTIIPPFISGNKRMWYLGAAILVSYIITKIFYVDYIISVWCFFASVISLLVYFVLQEYKGPYLPPAPAV